MASSSFGETLNFVTNVKLQEVEKRREAFRSFAATTLGDAVALDDDLMKKADVLIKGTEAWTAPWSSVGDLNVDNVKDWLIQAQRDPAFPPSLVKDWCSQLESRINRESVRFDYACLFGKLITEWLESSRKGVEEQAFPTPKDVDEQSVASQDDYDKISHQDTAEQQEKLESLIFQPRDIDTAALKAYLNGLFFSTKESTEALENLRSFMRTKGETLRRYTITTSNLKDIIKSLLSSDLLSDAKQATLKEFEANDVIVAELASVLNMQLASLSSWSWPDSGVATKPRRQLNGKIRFYLDYEILTALLLQFVGAWWAIALRTALTTHFFNSAAWQKPSNDKSQEDHDRFAVFVNRGQAAWHAQNIDGARVAFQRDKIFMCQLPTEMAAHNRYDDDGEGSDTEDGRPSTDKGDIKQELLHFMTTDATLTQEFKGECTIVRTDLEWFGPSLAHPTVLTVLEFFGMPEPDLEFMRSFLACPLQFTGSTRQFLADPKAYMANPAEVPRVRQRGLPIAHALSVFCGEAVLFTMDYAVNQRAGGLFLYRMHDDYWFWDSSSSRCAVAWTEMTRVAQLTGLQFNKSKTGSVRIGEVGELAPNLPSGDIRWGLLRMTGSTARMFEIDQEMVNGHIEELKRQLAATTSVFGYVQAFNKYMAFFLRNFGAPARIFGREHIDVIIETLAKILRSVFVDSNGSVFTKLAGTLKSDFNVIDIPTGWYLWPTGAGGLQIKDPMIDLLSIRKNFTEDKADYLARAYEEELKEYERLKKAWDEGGKHYPRPINNSVDSAEPFFSFDEYTTWREERSTHWNRITEYFLEEPYPWAIQSTPEMVAALKVMGDGIEAWGSTARRGWDGLSPYWKWLLSLHHNEMVEKYGSLTIVDPTSIPVGMVGVLKAAKMRWEE